MGRHVPCGSSNSPTGRNRVYPRAAKASSISSDKFTKRRSNSAKTVPSRCTAGTYRCNPPNFNFELSYVPEHALFVHFFLYRLFHNLFLICCSAGVGRTGVFITLSIVLERMQYEGVVDVFQAVRILRTQRPAMVQTEVHLIFVTIVLFHNSDFH